jgi:hypothetical protein
LLVIYFSYKLEFLPRPHAPAPDSDEQSKEIQH